MGRDGLVFVNVRKDIVKLKRKDNLAEAPFKEHGAGTSTRWSHCSVTGRPLDRPVFDELGKLYNKDSVIELLLDRKRAEMNAQADEKSKKKKKKKRKGKLMLKGNEIPTETHRACYHIRDLTDIKELRIKINPHYKEHTAYNTLALGKSNGCHTEQGFVKHPKYQCPITSAEFNGSKQFFGIWTCGHTVSEPVLRELKGKSDTHKCPVCNGTYEDIDLIRINPIHPDHKKESKELFHKRRKLRVLKSKLNRKMKKEIKQRRKVGSTHSKKDSDESDSDNSDESDSDASTSSGSTGSESEMAQLKALLAKKYIKKRLESRSRSASPIVIKDEEKSPKRPRKSPASKSSSGDLSKDTKPKSELDPLSEILVLEDSDDEEAQAKRRREEEGFRQKINDRRIQEFEKIIKRGRQGGSPSSSKDKAKKKRTRPPKTDPSPIVLDSD